MARPAVAGLVERLRQFDRPSSAKSDERWTDRIYQLRDIAEPHTDATLVEALDRLARAWGKPSTPTTTWFSKFMTDLDAEITRRQKARLYEARKAAREVAEQFDTLYATSQLSTPTARRAANEGWIDEFFSWCAKERRLPSEAESAELHRQAERRNEKFAAMAPGPLKKTALAAIEGRRRNLLAQMGGT